MHVFHFSLSCFGVVSDICVFIFSGDMENQVEQEEKTRLINQVLELQHTLEGIKAFFFSSPRHLVPVVSCCCFVTQYTPFMLLFFL